MSSTNLFVCDEREALEAARVLMEVYTDGRMEITEYEAALMMREVYRDTRIRKHFLKQISGPRSRRSSLI